MGRKTAAVAVLLSALGVSTAHAQECLHGPNESAEQAARRREALTATRMINNIEVRAGGGTYLRHDQLNDSSFAAEMRRSTNEVVKRISLVPGTDILPDWTLTLDVGQTGYWFMIADKKDPCGFRYISNQNGVIFSGEPIR